MEEAIKNLHSIHFRWAMRKLNKMIPKSFVPEKNKFEVWKDLKVFTEDEMKEDVEVGMLVGTDKKETLTGVDSSFNLPGYNWVFVWDEFKKRCKEKNIGVNFQGDDKSISASIQTNLHRLCLLMGLDTIKNGQKVALFKMKVNPKNMFRPAYNPMVTVNSFPMTDGKYSLSWHSNCNFSKEQQDEIEDWLAHLQSNNEYPWTRMGYTYDYAAKESEESSDGIPAYIGVSEFILMPDSKVHEVNSYPENYGLWDYSREANNP